MTESVKVIVRCRPMNKKQIQKNCQNVIVVDKSTHQIGLRKISSINTTTKQFAYDYVFGQDSTQQEVYQQTSFSLVENVLNGYNGTIFAYGQTGCGKTHTMLGVTTTLSTKRAQMISNNKQNLPVTVTSLKLQDQTMGIIPRAFRQIMTITNSQTNKNHLVHCTFIQIYNEQIHDLLGKDIRAKIHLQQTPDGLIMKDLSVHLAKNVSDMERYMEIGYKNRVIRETSMNKQSSRSHCIFTIRLQQSEYDQNGVQKFRVGKLNLVDLAGSQRQSKTNLKDDGIKQAAKINLSLSALGNVISALVDGKKEHIPYRDSKLTRILNDSLGGNTKTVMIATISPADYNYQETLSTLRYSSRAKFIQNKPIINQDPKDALLRKYEEQIRRLKLILEGKLPYTRGNETFYISNEKNEINIFKKFPQLQNEQNEEIMNRMNELNLLKEATKYKQNVAIQQQNTKNQVGNNANLKNKQEQQVQQLRNQLKFLQQIVKKQINTSPQVLQELNKINELKQKLRQQSIKEQKYKEQQKKRQKQLLNIENNYKNLNDEVDSIKIKFEQLRVKYVQNSQQLKDARQAHEIQKQQILDALRIQEAQNNKLMQILNVIVPGKDLQKIFKNCQWVHNTKQWIVPKFKFNQKSGVAFNLNKNSNTNNQINKNSANDHNNKNNQNSIKRTQKNTNCITQKDKKQKQNEQKFRNTDSKNTLNSFKSTYKKSQTNLLLIQTHQKDKLRRNYQSQQKINFNKNVQNEKNIKIQRNQSERQNLINMNMYRSAQNRKSSFKNSYYSDSTRRDKHKQLNINKVAQNNINNRKQQKKQIDKQIDKYKFSLQPLPKVKTAQIEDQPKRISLDLQQIKREIMNQMIQKNKFNSSKKNTLT